MSSPANLLHKAAQSLPARGAWVEMSSPANLLHKAAQSLPARGAWVEIL